MNVSADTARRYAVAALALTRLSTTSRTTLRRSIKTKVEIANEIEEREGAKTAVCLPQTSDTFINLFSLDAKVLLSLYVLFSY